MELAVQSRVVASETDVGFMAAFERSWFEAPEVVAYVSHLDISEAEEMAEIASAWTTWSLDPAACVTDLWFTALAWAAP